MIAAISWFGITLCGLGLPLALLLGGAEDRRRWCAGQDLTSLATLGLMYGLLADHAAGLVAGSLAFQAILAWVGGGVAMGALMMLARVRKDPAHHSRWPARAAWGLIGILALAIYARPLIDWDARSIWFFHGKAIFFDGGLKASPFWSNPAYDWSHKDYPKLVPMLAARYGAFTGAWNEFAPKGALVPLAAAGFLGLLCVSTPAGFLLLAPAAVAVLGATLWNGYMDGWLALCGATAALATGAWSESGRRSHLALCAAALGLALCLKSEGQLLAIAILPTLCWFALRRRGSDWRNLYVLAAFLPFAFWLVVRAKLALPGDLDAADLMRGALRMAGNPAELLYRLGALAQAAFAHSHLFGALGTTLVAGLCVGFRTSAVVCALSAALYAGGLVMVYLGTPRDFAWHVDNSLARVLMTPTLLLLSGLSTMIPDILPACRKAAPAPVS